MCDSRILRIVGLGLVFLFLAAVTAYAATGGIASAVQDPFTPDNPPPEVRDAGYSYGYMERIPAPDRTSVTIDDSILQEIDISLLAAEAQPKKLDWTPVRQVTVHPTNSQILFAAIDNWNGIWKSTDGGGFWTKLPIGLANGRTVVFANDNNTALASYGFSYESVHYNSGVYLSPDGAESWIDVSAGITATVVAAAFDPFDASRIYATTLGAGIYRTTNRGSSWTQINNGLAEDPYNLVYSIAVSPSNPDVLYAGGYYQVYRSDDGGDNWYVADNIYDSYSTAAVAVHPSDPNTFYAGARRLVQDNDEHTPSGFFKSVSGAGDGNLVLKNSGMEDTFVLDIAQDPLDPDILYAGTWGSGFFRSDDGGAHWYQKNRDLDNRYIYAVEATVAGADTVLYVATFYADSGVFKSLDRGETWTEVGAESDLYKTMFDVATTGSASTLAAATSRGAFWSNDGGTTWSPSTGLVGGEHGMVLNLAHLPGTSKLLAATYGGGVWTSVDAGHSWTETSAGLGRQEIFDVIFSPSEFNTAYAATEGVYRSVDGGDWSPVGSLGDWVRALDAAGGPPPDVFAGTNVSGVYWLPGGSNSWLPINSGLTEQRIRALKAVATDNLFAGTNGGSAWEYTFGARSSGLADPHAPAAVEGTNVWTKRGPYLTEPTAPSVIQIAIDPTNADIIYVGTDQGVYRSEDGGESWVPKNKNLGSYGALVISGLAIDPNNPTTIYLGTWGYGIYRSTDSGDTWERLFDPLKMSQIYLPLVLRSYAPTQLAYLNPLADTTILAGYPDNTFGDASDMWVGYDFDECYGGHTSRSLARFDTSKIPFGASISDATLYLHLVNSCDYDNRWHSITVYRIPSSWSYSSVTWNTRPGYAEAYGTTSVGSQTWGWYGFDVRGLVQGWVNGNFPNYGLMVRGPESSSTGARLGFATLNWEGTDHDPFIYVVWSSRDAQGAAVLPITDMPESDTLGPAIREMLHTFPNTQEDGPPGYVEQSAPED